MDPNTALASLRKAIANYNAAIDRDDVEDAATSAQEAIDAAEALDTWLSRGGSVPRGWEFARAAC